MKVHEFSVVLSGATDSIGPALARALVARGARVLLVARFAAPLAQLARELVQNDDHRHRVDALAADVTNAGALLGVRDAAVARGANILINAATVEDHEPLHALDATRIDAIMQTNLLGPVQVTRALLPHLLRQPAARVLTIGLPLGGFWSSGAAAMRASQLGLRGFCESLRRELEGTCVRVQFLATNAVNRGVPIDAAHAAVRMLVSGTHQPFFAAPGEIFGRLAQRLRYGSTMR